MNPYLLMFDPSYSEIKKNFGDLRIIKFQACIDLSDINEAFYVTLPSKFCENEDIDNVEKHDYTKDFYLQVILNNIGCENLQKNKYFDQLVELQSQKDGFATTFFKVTLNSLLLLNKTLRFTRRMKKEES